MEQTVYIDIFFLVNFSMDFLGLFLASALYGGRIRLWRLFLASVLGGAYACIALFFHTSGLLAFLLDALFCVAMSFIALFEKSSPFKFLPFSLVYGAVSILLGGAMTALFHLFNKIGIDKAFSGEQNGGDGVSVWLFAALAALSAALTSFGVKAFRRRGARREGRIVIRHRGHTVRIPCLCDSGNLLREPISRLPCIVVDPEALRGILSKSVIKSVREGDTSVLCSLLELKARIIPVSTASGEAILIGIRVDSLRLDMGKGESEVEAYLTLSGERITVNGIKALVPSELALGAA